MSFILSIRLPACQTVLEISDVPRKTPGGILSQKLQSGNKGNYNFPEKVDLNRRLHVS